MLGLLSYNPILRETVVYLRFTSSDAVHLGLRDGKRVHRGIFGPAYRVRRDKTYPLYLRKAIHQDLLWFEDKLPVPSRGHFCVRSKTWWRSQGICWFRDNAREMVSRAHGLRVLLLECDIFIASLRTERPGQILYKDDFQIIAKPDAATPTVWR